MPKHTRVLLKVAAETDPDDVRCVDVNSVIAWEGADANAPSSGPQGTVFHLLSGARLAMPSVSPDRVTAALHNHFGDDFAEIFMQVNKTILQEPPQGDRPHNITHVRRSAIIAWENGGYSQGLYLANGRTMVFGVYVEDLPAKLGFNQEIDVTSAPILDHA